MRLDDDRDSTEAVEGVEESSIKLVDVREKERCLAAERRRGSTIRGGKRGEEAGTATK